MLPSCDALVVGAATSGVYLAWRLAQRGHSVLVVDKEARDRVGQRLEVIHLHAPTMRELGVPPSREAPELFSKYNDVYVTRLPLFLQRMYGILERAGAALEFGCEFRELFFDGHGRVAGARLEQGGEVHEVKAKLLVDASGVASSVRTSLPDGYGVENWPFDKFKLLHVVLHYIEWDRPEQPHPKWGTLVPSHLLFLDPGYSDPRKDAILGVIAAGSFEKAESVFEDGVKASGFPPFTVKKREFNHFPLSRPLHSIVGDRFLCLGDAAAMMNPLLARGIPETWRLSEAALPVLDAVLKSGQHVTRESLWPINVAYQRGHGAVLASQYMITSFLYRLTAGELTFVFDQFKPVLDVEGAGRVHPHAILRAFAKVLAGVLGSRISRARVGQLLSTISRAVHAFVLYRVFPRDPGKHGSWVARADQVWRSRRRGRRTYGAIHVLFP
ncbi:MAG: NAD(P)/FAD-dependent oxidoreductase [Promethearchaeota archaeon]